MCGIAGVILKTQSGLPLSEVLQKLSYHLKHRGPDGEGFMIVDSQDSCPYFHQFENTSSRKLNYLPTKKISEAPAESTLGFVHRRLSIIDLSERAHQPMCNESANTWITYNGEIYNYQELRLELIQLGHAFISESDTEVILHAYAEWGVNCVEKLNGMWAFCIYDSVRKICFASRDRLGVKPFYYTNNQNYFAFASEQKALVKSGLSSSKVNEKGLHLYLTSAQLENETQNFFEDIQELWPGSNLIFNLQSHTTELKRYFDLNNEVNQSNNHLSDLDLIEKIKQSFTQSVQLRLRSDVEVGTCLSGGIDSSAIAVSIAELTKKPFYCFTSIFKNQTFNEEYFADLVAQKTGALHAKIEPNFEGLINELDELIYSQDVPIWDTSTYAQYKVMELAKLNHIKVVLDGQGADELFAGYHHHFLATWNHYFSKGSFKKGIQSVFEAKESIPNPLLFFIKERFKQQQNLKHNQLIQFLNSDYVNAFDVSNPSEYFDDLNQQLIHDIYHTRLKSFLKCEDRCGMWHSVESRVPFSDDIELLNLCFRLKENEK